MSYARLIALAMIECIPIAAMLLALPVYGFTGAVIATMFGAILSLLCSWRIDRYVPKFSLASTALLIVLGSLSVVSNDPDYIMVIDTLGSLAFALILMVSLYKKKLVLKKLFERYFAITDKGWRTLTMRWAGFFTLFALANEYVRAMHTPEAWVYFNAYGLIATLLFGTYQFTVSRRERLPEASGWGLRV